MPAIRIAAFRPAHLDRVLEIERACFGRLAYSRRLFMELHERCGPLFLVARRGSLLAGYAVACGDGGAAEIVSIAVDPRCRGRGVGRTLMGRLLELLAGAGIARVALMVRTDNSAAMRFYRRFGFRRARLVARYYEDGADGWLMRRVL